MIVNITGIKIERLLNIPGIFLSSSPSSSTCLVFWN